MVVEVVCGQVTQGLEHLELVKEAIHDRTNKLVSLARDIVTSSEAENEYVVMPQQNGGLLVAATGCVKAAGVCVAKTKLCIQRIGDFELEPKAEGLRIDVDPICTTVDVEKEAKPVPRESTTRKVLPPPKVVFRPPRPPLITPSYENPLGHLLQGDNVARLSPAHFILSVRMRRP